MKLSHDNPEIEDAHIIETSHSSVPAVPIRVMNGAERACMATDIVNGLTLEHSSIEAYVLLKNAENVIAQALEIDKERAVHQAVKDSTILTAEVTTRRDVKYEYEDETLADLEDKALALRKQIDERKKLLRTIKSEQADTVTGVISRPAKVVKDGLSLVVKLPE